MLASLGWSLLLRLMGIVGPGSSRLAVPIVGLQSFPGYFRLALVFVADGFWFSGAFGQCWQDFHFGGGSMHWAKILWSLDTFLILPNLLRSCFKSFGNS